MAASVHGLIGVYDCNDQSDKAAPGKAEVCDGVDNDCNGSTDVSVSNCKSNEVCTEGKCTCMPHCEDGWECGSHGCNGTCGKGCQPGSQIGDDPPCRTTMCGSDHKCGTGKPVLCYRDSDNDGFGVDSNSKSFCTGCRRGWVPRVGDCYDNHNGAFPGSATYSEVSRGDGSFDYDCDGKESLEQNFQANGCETDCAAARPCEPRRSMPQSVCGGKPVPTECVNECSSTGACTTALGTAKVQRCR